MKELSLYADAECWKFKWEHPDEFASYGCGPGGVGDFLIPDTVWITVSIRDACRIHDWGYRHCIESSEEDRARHDRILRNNAIRIVNHYTKSKLLKWLRYRRVQTYYAMVKRFGSNAYWEERNNADEYKVV